MKNNYIKPCIYMFLSCILAVQSACKKDWLDVNYNPKQLTDVNATPDLILPSLLERSVATDNQNKFIQQWMGYWSYYQMPPAFVHVSYNMFQADLYGISARPAPEIPYLERKAQESGQDFYLGIAKVLRALHWTRAVDVINNMPYTEAYNVDIRQPKYDSGQFIYEDCMNQLDQAQALIKNADMNKNLKVTLSDIMFHGDKLMWQKFINTLKLRLLVHQANRSDRATYVSTQISKITAEGSGFLASGQDAAVNPGYVIGKRLSAYFGAFSSHNQYGGGFSDALTQLSSWDYAHANVFAMNLLKANNDPRLGLFYSTIDQPVPVGAPEPFTQPAPLNYRGNTFGNYVNSVNFPYQNNSYVSAVGGSRNSNVVTTAAMGIIKGRNMSDWILTSVESMFLQAEAVQRGWIPGDAEQAYKTAVKESFRWLNAGGNSAQPALSDARFETWYTAQVAVSNPQVSWAAAPDKYKLIMIQKYHAFNGIEPMETWVDYRRNGRFPEIPVSQSPQRVGNTIPFRELYNQEEYELNQVNVNLQGSIDVFTSKIWWMP